MDGHLPDGVSPLLASHYFIARLTFSFLYSSYPIYSFFLPVYSFWSMDDFSWGNTRVVVGEGKEKTVLTSEGEYFDDSMIPLKKFSGQFAVSLAFSSSRLAC